MERYNLSPCLKWVGGKKQLLQALLRRMPTSFNCYYEPFIGGGALLLSLQPQKVIINDVNEQLLNVYKQLKKDANVVIELIEQYDAIDCSLDVYLSKREAFNNKIATHTLDVECAALMIWINKHCFNGLYRVNSKGFFNVPYNKRVKGSSIDSTNIRDIGNYLQDADITILTGDFEQACETVQSGDFVYLDSPYIPESKTANFTDYTKVGFLYEDHLRLAKLFKKLADKGAYVMLSNNDVPLIEELYAGYNIESLAVKRLINRDASKRSGQEVIITNY